jgi:hypothetical protein
MSSKKTHVPGMPQGMLAKAERRQWIRYPSAMEVSIRLLGAKEENTYPGELRDVSFVGAGLVSERCFERGTLLEVRPLNQSWSNTGKLLMRVRSTEGMASGTWSLGCTFVRHLTEEELQRLL